MRPRELQSGWEALLLSLYIPGAGQWLAGRRKSGVAWLVFFAAGLPAGYALLLSTRVPSMQPAAWLLAALVIGWCAMLVHAHRSVERGNPATRRPAVAALLSTLFPGLGQFLNRERVRGLVFAGAALLGLVLHAAMRPSSAPAWALLELLWQLGYGGLTVGSAAAAFHTARRRAGAGADLLAIMLGLGLSEVVLSAALGAVTASRLDLFKLPTQAMAPTLQGPRILPDDGQVRGLKRLLLYGERPVRVVARASGRLEEDAGGATQTHLLLIGGTRHEVDTRLSIHQLPGNEVLEGDLLASGIAKLGDRILVDRWAYRRRPPARGDLVIFSGAGMEHPQLRPDALYVKRVAGLPGETVGISPPHVVIDGEPLRAPAIFRAIAEGEEGYGGYRTAYLLAQPPPLLGTAEDAVVLGPDAYLVLGDNSENSLDGRYFGPIHRGQIFGRVVRICWPLDRQGIPN